MLERLKQFGRLTNHRTNAVDRVAAKVRLPLDRWYNERVVPDVRRLSASTSRNGDGAGPHVLIATLRVWQNHAVTEAMIGNALTERGARVSLVTCGGGLPICTVGRARVVYPRPCDRCAHFTRKVGEASGFATYRFSDYLPWGPDGRRAPERPEDVVEVATMDYERAGATTAAWVLKSNSPARVPGGPEVLRDTAVTAAAVELATRRVLDEVRPDILFLVNGILVEEQVMATVARERGIRVVTYGYGIYENTVMMTSGEAPALEGKNEELWEEVRGEPLSDEEDARLDELLARRERGSGTAAYFSTASDDQAELRARLRIPDGARVISLFTNVTWDSACLFKEIAFEGPNEWAVHAARVAAEHPDCVLVVRVHPAEAQLGTAEPAAAALRAEFPRLPDNVRVIEADEDVHSYTLVAISDLVLVYTSTVGMEAALRGKPVVVAGDTHYRGRGFTRDATTAEDVTAAIAGQIEPPGADAVELARRYAFAFFFRQMAPLPDVVRQRGPQFSEVPEGEIHLEPGADPYLDLICDRILDGRPLAVPRHLVQFPKPFPGT